MLGDNGNDSSTKHDDFVDGSPASTATNGSSPEVSAMPRSSMSVKKPDHSLSKSVVENFVQQKVQVAIVTAAVTTGAAAYVLMLFIAMPISIHLLVNMQQKGCDPELTDDCFAATDESQTILTLTLSLLRTMTFLMGGTMGVLSDRYGRRPMLLIALTGYATTGLLLLIGWQTETVGLFIFGGIVLGASSPITPHGIAYVSDVSRPDRLATNMGYLQGLGYFCGLLLGAVISLGISQATRGAGAEEGESALAPYNDLFNISYGAGFGFAALMVIIMFFKLPESLHKDERATVVNWKKANPFGFLGLISRTKYLGLLWMSAAFGWMGVGAGESVTGGWWLRRYTQSDVNKFILFTVAIWIGSAFGAAIMTPLMEKLVGLKNTIHFTMIASISVGFGFAWAETAAVSYTAVGLSFLAAPVVPALISLLMGQVPSTEKGRLAGAIRSSEALAKLIGIVMMGNTFSIYIEPYTPELACVPLDYGSSNPANTCDCGVNTCPTYDPTNSSGRVFDESLPFYYEPAPCTLGNMSPIFDGKPSAHVAVQSPQPNPPVPQYFVDEGFVTRDDTCQGAGGIGDSDTRMLARQWCISAESMEARGLSAASAAIWNEEYGCPGFDFGLYVEDMPKYENMAACEADLASPTCNQTLFDETNNNPDSLNYDAEEFVAFTGIYTNITNGVEATCESFGQGEMNLCWQGVIADFPGLFPFVYASIFGTIAYLFFIVAEVFYKHEDCEYWRYKKSPASSAADAESPSDPAQVRPTNA
ncbi:Hypothetical Protein FCC1311_016942 [Hondaea fermentalgiana]|uniref:Major facilitator superfamily (MFS) profile domain-containing protein n=1 Tax=Hondaea fermentalgiana TaxID=2315210 RepID=A0A2R5G4J3_9STRA|nr:Hypothetical Protein FCC1311_016942 [Hondaea fermentalgiana]|eukprot:GBG25475.1 Hypothetical Protein FCC1311_016942 [Hondaea fermentalgiana]